MAAKSIQVGPRELNRARVSLLRAAVPSWLAAPTVSTHGAFPGLVIPPYCTSPCVFVPMLPAAAMTTMPASTARRAACVSGSVS